MNVAMALLIDTGRVGARDRASHFLGAVMASPLPACDASGSRFEADDFRARFYFRELGDAYLTEMSAAGLHLNRSRREIDRRPCGQLLVAFVRHGGCRQDFGRCTPVLAEPDDLLLLDLDAPQTASFEFPDLCDLRVHSAAPFPPIPVE